VHTKDVKRYLFSITRIKQCNNQSIDRIFCNAHWSDSEEDLGLLRGHWIIGPPFVDRKSLATMNNAKGTGGWQTLWKI
jgi:hypothetical protein